MKVDRKTTSAQAVINAELAYLKNHRNRLHLKHPGYSAFAISGGGMRASSFGLGVMQALVSANIMKQVDYLSTTSGGAYIGASLTWYLNQGLPYDKNPAAGVETENFPFGKARVGSRITRQHEQDNEKSKAQISALDYIRQHGNYLSPCGKLGKQALLATALRTSFISLLAYFSLISCVILVFIKVGAFDRLTTGFSHSSTILPMITYNGFVLASTFLLTAYVFINLIFSMSTRILPSRHSFRYTLRTQTQVMSGWILVVLLISAILGLFPLIQQWLEATKIQIEMASLSTALGTLMAIIQLYRQQLGTNGVVNGIVNVTAAFLIIYGIAFGAYLFADAIKDSPLTIGVVVGTTLLVSLMVNSNYLSMHRTYRDRLMEAFLPNLNNAAKGQWELATDADRAPLSEMCKTPNERPYHLINTNIVLINSLNAKFRCRGGDSFVLSPLYSGSDATQWIATKDLMGKGNTMTLATAMAISGASLNPNAGNSGRGITRNRIVSALLTLLNIRLGYWLVNPRKFLPSFYQPNFLHPGLMAGVFGRNYTEQHRVIELTDGGHFDNTGLYELIRRRIDLIILADGSSDATFSFDDLGNAVEKVRVDFGVQILFDDPDYNLNNLQPGSAKADEHGITQNLIERYGLSRHGFAVGTIKYPDPNKKTGTLIYLKTTMINGLPTDVLSYKSLYAAFPHESTADQFFNETQFEAYRELGYYQGWEMLKANGETDRQGNWTPTNKLACFKT